VSFSSCGEYLVTKQCPSSYAKIRPIPPHLLQSGTRVLRRCSKTPNPANEDALVKGPTFGSLGVLPASGELVRGEAISCGINGLAKGVRTIQSTENLELQLWQTGEAGESSKTIELTRLPEWDNIGNVEVSIHMPRSRDEIVRIILNKAAKPWNDFSEAPDTHLPAVIARDQRSLKRVHIYPGDQRLGDCADENTSNTRNGVPLPKRIKSVECGEIILADWS